MKYIGLDIHKKETQTCVMDEKRKIVLVKRVRTDVSDIGHLFGMIEDDNKEELAVVMEAIGFYFWIHDLIVEPDCREHARQYQRGCRIL